MPHHFDAFVPMGAAGIGTADIVGFDVGQLSLDGIRMPLAHFVQKRARSRPKPMRRYLLFPIPQPS